MNPSIQLNELRAMEVIARGIINDRMCRHTDQLLAMLLLLTLEVRELTIGRAEDRP